MKLKIKKILLAIVFLITAVFMSGGIAWIYVQYPNNIMLYVLISIFSIIHGVIWSSIEQKIIHNDKRRNFRQG